MPIPSLGQELRIRQDSLFSDYFRSRVVDLTSAELIIDEPIHHKTYESMQLTDSELWVEFYGPDGANCRFLTQCTTVSGDEGTATWHLPRPKLSDVVREQRREFVRVFATLPVLIVTGGTERRCEVHTRDISGGGLSVLLPRSTHLSAGDTVQVKFTIPSNDYLVDVKCFVVRVSEANESGFALASLKFLDMKESVRQKIIRYTFERQRATM